MPEYETKQIFSSNLTMLLEKNKETQLEFAQKIGVSPSSVSSWCNGEKMPRMDKVELIANHFSVTKSFLLEGKGDLITDNDIKFALFKGSKEITDEMYQEVLDYAAYVEQKYLKDKK